MATDFTIFPFSITNIAYFSVPKSILISLLKTCIVRTNKSSPLLWRLYNFKSFINKRLLIFSLLPENSFAALAFHKIKRSGIDAKTNSKGDKGSP